MNSILLWLGIIVALALSAAFAAPFFIDWSGQRGFFEARAAAIIGRPVEFAGPLEVRLVPFPSLTARDVRVGTETDQGGEGADAVVIRAALAPLLSGELHISELVLVRPRLTVVIETDGTPRLAAGNAGSTLPVAPERTRVDRFEVQDGTIALEDARTGERREVSSLNLNGSAGTLAGPFRADGGGRIDGSAYTLSIATGRLQADSSLRVTASIIPADRPITVNLDGTLALGEDTPHYQGQFTMARPDVEDSDATPWRIAGQVAASAETAVFEELTVQLGDEAQRIALTGTASLLFGAAPRFDAVLASRQMDLDRSFGGGPEDPITPAHALTRMTELLDPAIFPLPGSLSVDVSSLVVAGNLVEELELDLGVEGGRWRIDRAAAYLPGQTDVGVSGTIGFDEAEPVFDGVISLASRRSGALAKWLFGPEATIPGLGAVAGRLDAAASMSLGPNGIGSEEFSVETAETQLTGSLSYAPADDDGRARLAMQIETDRFDLDSLTGIAGDSLADLASAPADFDLDLQFDTDTLRAGPVEIGDVHVRLAKSQGDIRVDRLHVGDFGGVRVSGQGEIRDAASAPEGSFAADVEAQSLDAVAESLRALGFDGLADGVAARGNALVPARLSLSLEAGRNDGDGTRGQLSLSGNLDSTELDLSLGFDGDHREIAQADIELAIEAASAEPAGLLRQLGVPADIASGEEGRVSLAATGRPVDAMAFTLTTSGIGVDGSAEGHARFVPEGGREISAAFGFGMADPGAVLEAAGITLPPGNNGRGRIDGQLSAVDDVWRLSDLVVVSGSQRIAGTLSVDFGGPQRVAQGGLRTTQLDLPWLLGALLGPDAIGMADDDQGESAWSQAAFVPVDRSGWRAAIRLETPRLALGGPFVAQDATLELEFDPERLAFNEMTGTLAGGRLGADVSLATAQGMVRLDGRLALEDARLEEIVWRADGRPVATGALSTGIELSGGGRSLPGLVSTLSGEGSFRVEDGIIRRINPHAFARIVSAADAGLTLTEERVRDVFAGHLDAGSLTFDRIEGSFTAASGVLRARSVRIGTESLESLASATVDLGTLAVDSEWTLQVEAEEEQGRTRQVGIVFAGPIAEPSRMIDVNPLLGYLTVRAFEQEVERLEALQADILERERLGREMLRLGEQRRRREREAAEQARREAEEMAERQAQEEAERQAQEQAEEEARIRAEEEAARRAEEEARRREEASRREEARRRQEELREGMRQAPQSSAGDDPGLEQELQRLIEESLRRVPPDAGVGAPPYEPAPSGLDPGPLPAPGQVRPPTAPLDIRPPASRS